MTRKQPNITSIMHKLVVGLFLLKITLGNDDFCLKDNEKCQNNNVRYLLYDINPPEGFNLRRDVYMRLAVLGHQLQASGVNFKLVLPPWSHLYHWRYSKEPEHIPWSYYFDVMSLKRFAPVIEMFEFFEEISIRNRYSNEIKIDEVYNMEHFNDMFETNNFENRMEITNCTKKINLGFFHYTNLTAKSVRCLRFHGPATMLDDLLKNTNAKIIMLNHAEIVLHDFYGDKKYWEARRSMRFNKELIKIANKFRKKILNSTNSKDGINIPENWQDEKPHRNAKGGPFLGVHLRRKDFVKSRPDETPSIKNVTTQLKTVLQKIGLTTIFLATDASKDELTEFKKYFHPSISIVTFTPDKQFIDKYKDGGAAIIEQIICSHSNFFIGTQESTFSFRIQEEREILGFPVQKTFNVLCKDVNQCQKPSIWTIVH